VNVELRVRDLEVHCHACGTIDYLAGRVPPDRLAAWWNSHRMPALVAWTVDDSTGGPPMHVRRVC
jgi:hypothetical protein